MHVRVYDIMFQLILCVCSYVIVFYDLPDFHRNQEFHPHHPFPVTVYIKDED